jgi:cell division protein FtsI (penicillin-binding protein 3)
MSPFQRKKINMLGVRRSALDQARSRLVLLSMFFVFAYVIVVARAADLSIIQGALHQAELSESRHVSSASEEKVTRADIVDRNGVLLARSLKTTSLFVDPVMVQEPAKTAKKLQDIFPNISYGSLLQKLQSKKRFVWIKRNMSPEEQVAILNLGQPGLNFKQEMQRIYPQGALASHMVGASGVDGQGLAGVEASFDKYLATQSEPLQLTLDVRVQHVLKREISSTMKSFGAKGGAGIVMDIETGEILAATSLPDFDPHNYKHAKRNEIFNRVTLGAYELGSTFKIFSTAALLEKNNSNMAQKFDVREPIKVGRFKIRDYHPEKRMLTLPEVFIHSSNIGSAMMGQEVGTASLKDFYADIGLFNTPEFEIPEMGRPILPSPWREVNTLTASYGHGIAVSPLQLVKAAGSIMNGGVLISPTLVKQSSGLDQSNKKSNSSPELRVVSPQTSHRMRQLMRLVVTEGTGSKADVEGFLVGGKTGTAEKPGKGGYDRKKLISSFLGVFPMDAPRYVVFVMVDEPQGTKESYGYATGGWVGAPTVGRIVSSMASVMGLSPNKTTDRFEDSLIRHIKTKAQVLQEKREREIATH